MLNSLGLGFIFTAKDMASGKISDLARSFGGMDRAALSANESYQKNFAAMGVGLGIMGAGAATLAGAFALAGVAGDFEQQIAKVGAISQSSAKDLQRLHDAALEAGLATKFSPIEAAQGLEALASQGFNAAESIRLLKPALDLAAGGGISVESATASTAAAVRVFGLNMEAATKVADKLLAISNTTALAAGDMELALGTVGRGASMTGQSLEEMLVSMGLVRNTGVDASVAAQSVSSALVFMSGRADAFKKLGVSVTDAQGKFRPFLDVVTDTASVLDTKYTDQAERAAMATKLFSRFGLQAYSAIVKQLGTGIRNDTTGAILKGAEAMAYLREQMENTDGVAKKFQDQMMDTFEGQKTLLMGAAKTLAIVLGEPFAQAFKPFVSGALAAVRGLVEWVREIPAEVKGPLFKTIVVVSALAVAFGGVLAAVAGFVLLKPFLLSMGVALGGVAAAVLPLLLYIAAIGVAVAALKYVIEENIGSMGYLWRRFSAGARAAFRGVIQLFTQGGFSGEVQEWFSRVENQGLKRFVISLYQVGFRVVQFFRGVKLGVMTGLEAAAPAFKRLTSALFRLGEAFGLVASAGPKLVAGIPSQSIAERGARIGLFISKIIEWVVGLATVVAEFVGGFIDGFSSVVQFFGPAFSLIGPTISWLGELFWDLLRTVGLVTGSASQAGSGWRIFGQIVGGVAGVIGVVLVGALQLVGWAIGGLIILVDAIITAFKYLVGFIFRVGEFIGAVIMGIINLVANLIDGVIVSIGTLASKIPASVRPAWADSLASANENARGRINKRFIQDKANFKHVFTSDLAPGAAEAEIRAEDSKAQQAAMSRVGDMVAKQTAEREANRGPPVILQVDGEKLGEVAMEGYKKSRGSAFEPVGSPKG